MFNGLLDGWRLPFSAIYLLVSILFVGWMWRRNVCRQQRALQALSEQPTLKTVPTLPTVILAAFLDASDTTPEPEQETRQLIYCPACWIEDIGAPWRFYYEPSGSPQFCGRHAYLTLARALSAQQQQQETGDKYL